MANNFLFAQLDPFLLAGSGAIIGDITLTLQSFNSIDGVPLSMANFGSVGFGTIEPGNGNLEEQISFTNLVQNSNGTCTLQGISNVSFLAPYTQTSRLAKTHAGATTFIISNTSGFYNQFVAKDDDGTISETLTFTQPNFPQMDGITTPPSLPAQLVTKAYADSLTFAGAPNASTSAKGIVQIATQAQVDAKTIIGSTSAVLVQPLNTQRSTLLSDYVIDTSTSPNIIVITPSPAITSYQTGQQFSFKVANTNTSPSIILNVNGLGAKNITKLNGMTSPAISDMVAGQMIIVEYDGTNFQLETPVANAPALESEMTGIITMFGGSTAPNNWLLCNGSPVSRATYASLFICIASVYGNGDGSTTFNVPNMAGRFVAGPSSSLSNTLGATGGSLNNPISVSYTANANGTGGGSGVALFLGGTGTVITSSGSPSIIPPYIITNYIIHI